MKYTATTNLGGNLRIFLKGRSYMVRQVDEYSYQLKDELFPNKFRHDVGPSFLTEYFKPKFKYGK